MEHALASRRLHTDGAEVLVDYADDTDTGTARAVRSLVVVRNGQRVFNEVVEAYLRRVEYGPDGYPRLIELPAYAVAKVVVDPTRGFGQPIFRRGGARLEDALAMFRAGDSLETVAEVYGIPADEDVADVDWLELADTRGWVVLTKDERIRYRPAERRALVDHKVVTFCLTSGNRFSTPSPRPASDCWTSHDRNPAAPRPLLLPRPTSRDEPFDLSHELSHVGWRHRRVEPRAPRRRTHHPAGCTPSPAAGPLACGGQARGFRQAQPWWS